MPTVKLNIPYRSQWDPDAKDHFADCGPTSLCMMLNALGDPINPDQMYQYIGERGASEYTSFSDLMRAGKSRGLTLTPTNFVPQRALDELKAKIDAGFPFIALVNYAFWDAIAKNNFKGSHFVLVSGYDDGNIFVHDPLFREPRRDQGKYCAWTYKQFTDAWGGFAPGQNPNYAGLMPDKTVPHLDDAAPVPTPSGEAPTTDIKRVETPAGEIVLDDSLRRRLRAKAAYDKQDDPNLDDPNVVHQLMQTLGNFGSTWDTYTVRPGDSLSRVSTIFYGTGTVWKAIVYFNDIANPSIIKVGDTFMIPKVNPKPTDDATVPIYGQGGPTG